MIGRVDIALDHLDENADPLAELDENSDPR
jgi:hypothetical protein